MRFYLVDTREVMSITLHCFTKEDDWGNEVYDNGAEDMLCIIYDDEMARMDHPYACGMYVVTKAEFDVLEVFFREEERRMWVGERSQITDYDGYEGEDYEHLREATMVIDIVDKIVADDDIDEEVNEAIARHCAYVKAKGSCCCYSCNFCGRPAPDDWSI